MLDYELSDETSQSEPVSVSSSSSQSQDFQPRPVPGDMEPGPLAESASTCHNTNQLEILETERALSLEHDTDRSWEPVDTEVGVLQRIEAVVNSLAKLDA